MSWQVDFGGMKKGYFKREVINSTTQLEKWIKYFDNKDVYIGCYYKQGPMMYGYFYLDFDADLETDYTVIKEETLLIYKQIQEDFNLQASALQLYFSGAKGFHLLVAPFNLGFNVCDNLNVLYKMLALYYKKIAPSIDIKIYDARRVLRMPNSINGKTGLYKVPLTYDELLLNDYVSLCNYAKTPHAIKKHSYISFEQHKKNKLIQERFMNALRQEEKQKQRLQSKVFDRTLLDKEVIFPCVERMLNDIHGEGERNKRLIIIASHLLQKGVALEETIDFLIGWNITHFEPPLHEQEVRTTVTSAQHQLKQGRKYGCHAILEIDYCDFKCSFINQSNAKGEG